MKRDNSTYTHVITDSVKFKKVGRSMYEEEG